MDRTPVRVRGKSGNQSRHDLKLSGGMFGSRLSSLASRPTSRTASPALTSSKDAQTRHFSLLETLPNEVLHRIFLYALNLDLPAVSLPLSRAFNGVGALYVKLEYAFRVLYKPLSYLGVKLSEQAELICTKPHTARWLPPKSIQVSFVRRSMNPPWRPEAKIFLLESLEIHRWKDYRRASLQRRLTNARFFNWNFFAHLIQKAHPIFQKELADVHAALGLRESELLPNERWWINTSPDDIIDIMHDYGGSRSRSMGHLPWLLFKCGVRLPSRFSRVPLIHSDAALLLGLYRAACGTILRIPGEIDPETSVQPLPDAMLVEAIKQRQEWIVRLCVVRSNTRTTTEMLRLALTLEPFSFDIVEDLLCGAYWRRQPGFRFMVSSIDGLDPYVWSFIEQQERREATHPQTSDEGSTTEDRASIAKWLRQKLRGYEARV